LKNSDAEEIVFDDQVVMGCRFPETSNKKPAHEVQIPCNTTHGLEVRTKTPVLAVAPAPTFDGLSKR